MPSSVAPGEQVIAQVLVDQLGALGSEKGQQGQHEADVVFRGALVAETLDSAGAHPGPQRQGALAEDDTVVIGVDRPPRRRGKAPRAHEQTAVLPNQVVVIGARSQTGAHQRQGCTSLGLIGEGPLGRSCVHV